MAKKPITGYAPGYWGGSPHKRIKAENIIPKVTSWNYDKIMAMGMPYAMWREASKSREDLLMCSCYKDTAKQPDVPCLMCYGTGRVPGYFKFGTKTYWASATDPGWTLTNMVLDKANRPFRLHLVDGQLSGTAISAPVIISTIGKNGAWESNVDGYTRDGGAASSILVEFSADAGATWHLMSQLETISPSATITFRVTISRNTATVKSPVFEIVRVRYSNVADFRGEVSEPVIRIISTWDKNAEARTQYGTRVDSSGKRFWTLPLNFFDASLQRESDGARIEDDAILESRYGGNIGTRFAVVEFDYSDTFGEFTRQEFGLRQFSGEPGKIQGEFAYRIW